MAKYINKDYLIVQLRAFLNTLKSTQMGDAVNLKTTKKVIVPAINELKEKVDICLSLNHCDTFADWESLYKHQHFANNDAQHPAAYCVHSDFTLGGVDYPANSWIYGTDLVLDPDVTDNSYTFDWQVLESVNGRIGDMSALTTDEKDTLVEAVSEVKDEAELNKEHIGDVDTFIDYVKNEDTTDETDVVEAINNLGNKVVDLEDEAYTALHVTASTTWENFQSTYKDIEAEVTTNGKLKPKVYAITNDFEVGDKKYHAGSMVYGYAKVFDGVSAIYKYDWKIKDVVNGEMGYASDLTTTEKNTIVGAINEHDNEIGDLTFLTTTNKFSVVEAINELDEKQGDQTLTTTSQTLSGAVNELDADLGDVTDLTTTAKDDVVSAVNELDEKQGDEVLTTTAQTLSGAVNELDEKQGNESLTTDAQTLSGAVNELDLKQGGDALTTMSKNLSGAVNEHDAEIGNLASLATKSTDNLVAALNDMGNLNDVDGEILDATIVAVINKAYDQSKVTIEKDTTDPTIYAKFIVKQNGVVIDELPIPLDIYTDEGSVYVATDADASLVAGEHYLKYTFKNSNKVLYVNVEQFNFRPEFGTIADITASGMVAATATEAIVENNTAIKTKVQPMPAVAWAVFDDGTTTCAKNAAALNSLYVITDDFEYTAYGKTETYKAGTWMLCTAVSDAGVRTWTPMNNGGGIDSIVVEVAALPTADIKSNCIYVVTDADEKKAYIYLPTAATWLQINSGTSEGGNWLGNVYYYSAEHAGQTWEAYIATEDGKNYLNTKAKALKGGNDPIDNDTVSIYTATTKPATGDDGNYFGQYISKDGEWEAYSSQTKATSSVYGVTKLATNDEFDAGSSTVAVTPNLVQTALALKADVATTYTKVETDALLDLKVATAYLTANYYDNSTVDSMLASLQKAYIVDKDPATMTTQELRGYRGCLLYWESKVASGGDGKTYSYIVDSVGTLLALGASEISLDGYVKETDSTWEKLKEGYDLTKTLQEQIDSKMEVATGAIAPWVEDKFNAEQNGKVLVSSAGYIDVNEAVSVSELETLDGMRPADGKIQEQLDGKQAKLVGIGDGQNIKSINGESILTAGNIDTQEKLVDDDATKQNIKTIHGKSVLGKGDLKTIVEVEEFPSGVNALLNTIYHLTKAYGTAYPAGYYVTDGTSWIRMDNVEYAQTFIEVNSIDGLVDPQKNAIYYLKNSQGSNLKGYYMYAGRTKEDASGSTVPAVCQIDVDADTIKEKVVNAMFDIIYPVGSIYISVNSTIPTSFKGTWQQLAEGTSLWNQDVSSAAGQGLLGSKLNGSLPNHNHVFSGSKVNTDGMSKNSSGQFRTTAGKVNYLPSPSGAFSDGGSEIQAASGSDTKSRIVKMDVSHTHSFTASGTINNASVQNTVYGAEAGTNVVRPTSIAVTMWKRIN